MRLFGVYTPSGKLSARLEYDEETDTAKLELCMPEPYDEASAHFQQLRMVGNYFPNSQITESWIYERVCPPERDGIDYILQAHGLNHYSPWLLSIAMGGRSVVDNLHFVENTNFNPVLHI